MDAPEAPKKRRNLRLPALRIPRKTWSFWSLLWDSDQSGEFSDFPDSQQENLSGSQISWITSPKIPISVGASWNIPNIYFLPSFCQSFEDPSIAWNLLPWIFCFPGIGMLQQEPLPALLRVFPEISHSMEYFCSFIFVPLLEFYPKPWNGDSPIYPCVPIPKNPQLGGVQCKIQEN